jgi:hypothetical protein
LALNVGVFPFELFEDFPSDNVHPFLDARRRTSIAPTLGTISMLPLREHYRQVRLRRQAKSFA